MSISISQQEQSLQARIDQANEKIVAAEENLRTQEAELSSLLAQKDKHRMLDEVYASLEKLGKTGAADLFRNATGSDPQKQSQQVRDYVNRFQKNIADLEESSSALKAIVKDEQNVVRVLKQQLDKLREAAKLKNIQEIPKRTDVVVPYRVAAMPWTIQGEDERRFRKILVVVLSIAIVFGGLIPVFRPPVDHTLGVVVPERIARIIKKKQEAKQEEAKQAAKLAEQKLPEKTEEKTEEKPKEKVAEKATEVVAEPIIAPEPPKPTLADTQKARSAVEKKGVLAFKSNFAELMDDASDLKIGANARISSKADRESSGESQRAVIVSQATGGGSSSFTINRQSEGSGSQRIVGEGVKFTKVESSASQGDRPLSKGAGPSRTDEEIQIVFDRYKSALYRIYNRELRVDPTLRGSMVLRIVIEPDGRVSSCTVKSTDMPSASLSADIVSRVLNFNFGPKEGVPAITILYPIDFLPAN